VGGEAAAWQRFQRRRLGGMLVPEIARRQAMGQRVAFPRRRGLRGPAIYEALEAPWRGLRHPHPPQESGAGDRRAISFGRRTAQPQAARPLQSSQYQADSWTTARRIVAKSSTTSANCSRASAYRHGIPAPQSRGRRLQQAWHG